MNDSFLIWTKTGIVRELRPQLQNSAGLTYQWVLARETDTHGNETNYSYANGSDGEPYLAEISYGDTTSVLGAHIKFYSAARTDQLTYGRGESLGVMRQRLLSIDVTFGGSRVRTYMLNYHASGSTSGSLLDSVQVFGRDATVNCGTSSVDPCDNSKPQGFVVSGKSLPPPTFQYDETAKGTFQLASATQVDWGNMSNGLITGDFNGDGKADYLSVGTVGVFDTYLSNGDGTFTLNNNTKVPAWCNKPGAGAGAFGCFENVASVVVGDFNGDGKTDFMLIADNLEVFLSNGDGTFNSVSSPPPAFCNNAPAYQCLRAPLPNVTGSPKPAPPYARRRPRILSPGEIITGDFNGDGKTDFLFVADSFYTFLSNGDGTFRVVSTAPPSWATRASDVLNTQPNHIIVGDFDGDGKTDFLSANGNFDIFQSNGDGTFTWIPTEPPPTCTDGSNVSAALCLSTAHNAVIVGDFNGDGKTDFISSDCASASSGQCHVFLSNGHGSFTDLFPNTLPALCAAPDFTSGCLSQDPNHVIVGDFNGDGKTDFMSANLKSNFDIWISRGDGNFRHVTGPPGCPTASKCIVGTSVVIGDFNGDGKTDFLSAGMWLALGGPADHLIKISNGIGATTAISYAPSSKYLNTFLPVGTVYQTVAATTVSDGRGVSDSHTYEYAGGLWDSGERRFLGFGTMTEVIDAAGNYNQTLYSQTAACFSQPVKTYLKDPQGNVYRFSTFSYVALGNVPYQCLLSSRVDYQAERTCNDDASCAQSARPVGTDFLYDGYGNLSAKVEHGDLRFPGDERTTEWGYFPNTTAYIVALPGFQSEGTRGKWLKESAFFYDNQLNNSSPPTRGDLTLRRDSTNDRYPVASTIYNYDGHGNVTAVTDANIHTSATKFDQTYNLYPVQTCNALAQCSSLDWDIVLGKLKSVTDANGAITKYSYDPFGRRIQVANPDGGTVQDSYELTFDESGSPTGLKVGAAVSGGSAEGHWTDGLGRTYRTVKKGGYQKDVEYSDATQNPSRESTWYQAPDSPQCMQYTYDGAKRLTDIVLPDGAHFHTTYGVAPDYRVTQYDALGREKSLLTDAYGRTTRVWEDAGHFKVTSYIYDPLGRLTQLTDTVGSSWLTTWDMLGRKLSMSDPDMGTWTYTYDTVGNLLTQTDALRQTMVFSYDALNRKKSKTYPDGSKVVWNYDEGGHGAGVGRLTSVSELTASGVTKGSDRFSYDVMGRVTAETKCRDKLCATTNSAYDIAGRLSRLTYPDATGAISTNSETVVYAYDGSGRLLSVTGNVPYVNSIVYEPDGQVSLVAYGNRTSAQFSFDAKRRWLSSASILGPGTPPATLYSANYTHDASGRICAISSATNPLVTLTFEYDDLDRLTKVSRGQTQQFAYDDIGNMKWNSAVGTYTYSTATSCSSSPCNNQPHAVLTAGNNTYTYDANGNLKSGGGRTITWNFDNRPLSVTTGAGTTSFDYDSANQRVSKREPGDPAPTYYFGPFVELEPTGAFTYSYYAGPTLVARRSGGTLSWYHQDHLGSVRLITDANGNVVHHYDYAAFGTTLLPAGDAPDPYGFTGQLRNPSTSGLGGDVAGLIYMNARYYDATLGRFISPDTIVPDPTDPQSINRYSYVLNNPVSFTDSSGLSPDVKWSALARGSIGFVWAVYKGDPVGVGTNFLAIGEALGASLTEVVLGSMLAGEIAVVVLGYAEIVSRPDIKTSIETVLANSPDTYAAAMARTAAGISTTRVEGTVSTTTTLIMSPNGSTMISASNYPDGSSHVSIASPDGSQIDRYVSPDGTVQEIDRGPDGTQTTTVITPDGNRTTTLTGDTNAGTTGATGAGPQGSEGSSKCNDRTSCDKPE